MTRRRVFPVFFLALAFVASAASAQVKVSDETETCLTCHAEVTPGIVADWRASRMSRVTPAEALRAEPQARRISVESAPEGLADVVVGCYECHGLDPDEHPDTFDHAGFSIHVVVTPEDCATCHPVEVEQYGRNLMSQAYGNLKNNPVYMSLARSINGVQSFDEDQLRVADPDPVTESDSCLHCHGTKVEVKGTETRDTILGEMDFPVLTGWPNQGVGRINPDGSKGSCASCHARHRFSIEMARKPHTCSECHKGPDVPAYKVYSVSKHGNIFSTHQDDWDFEAVPWTVGEDFTAPTCATCHASLLVDGSGEVVAERTHQMSDRLPTRLFGIYAHPHPIKPDTSIIRNKAGLPLPVELTGEPASPFLIAADEQAARRSRMQQVCLSCHSKPWVEGHFARLDRALETTNEMTLAATRILTEAWSRGLARGAEDGDSLFNEAIEKKWAEQWLFYANSTRFASAMAGADYGVFAEGRWHMSRNVREMAEWLDLMGALARPEEKPKRGTSRRRADR